MKLKTNVTRPLKQACRSGRKQSVKSVNSLPFSVSGIIEILERYGKIAVSETAMAPPFRRTPPPRCRAIRRSPCCGMKPRNRPGKGRRNPGDIPEPTPCDKGPKPSLPLTADRLGASARRHGLQAERATAMPPFAKPADQRSLCDRHARKRQLAIVWLSPGRNRILPTGKP